MTASGTQQMPAYSTSGWLPETQADKLPSSRTFWTLTEGFPEDACHHVQRNVCAIASYPEHIGMLNGTTWFGSLGMAPCKSLSCT